MRYDLTDFEWSVIDPLCRRGVKPKVNRRILKGIFRVLRAGAPSRDVFPNDMGLAPRRTTASIGGAKRVSGTA
jgi:transposase